MTSASRIWMALATAGLAVAATGTAHAVSSYGNLATPPGIYVGNTPTNGEFTIDTTGGIEVGIRAKDRGTFASINGSSGIYETVSGYCNPVCGGSTKARWNYDFSVNTFNTGLDLRNFRVQFDYDTDPTAGVNLVTIPNAFTNWGDNEYVIGSGPKRVDSGLGPQTGEDVFQQSANPLFGNSGFMPGFNVFAEGIYDIRLSVFSINGGPAIASTGIHVQVIPEPETYAMLLAGLGLLGFVARRRKQKDTATA